MLNFALISAVSYYGTPKIVKFTMFGNNKRPRGRGVSLSFLENFQVLWAVPC